MPALRASVNSMRPTLGRVVLYRNASTDGVDLAARITIVVPKPGMHPSQENDENAYRVWLAIDWHFYDPPTGLSSPVAETVYTAEPIPFAEAPAPQHWRWPPRV